MPVIDLTAEVDSVITLKEPKTVIEVETECQIVNIKPKIRLIEEALTEFADRILPIKCGVCQEIVKQPAATLCGHIFCLYCVKQAVELFKSCPVCRRPLQGTRSYHRLFL